MMQTENLIAVQEVCIHPNVRAIHCVLFNVANQELIVSRGERGYLTLKDSSVKKNDNTEPNKMFNLTDHSVRIMVFNELGDLKTAIVSQIDGLCALLGEPVDIQKITSILSDILKSAHDLQSLEQGDSKFADEFNKLKRDFCDLAGFLGNMP